MHVTRAKRSPMDISRQRAPVSKWLGVLAVWMAGCGGGNDYYFLNDIKGEGDTVLLEFIYTCGAVDVSWNGSFGTLPHYSIELTVKHDAPSGDCAEDPREVAFDVGPIKGAFRKEHP